MRKVKIVSLILCVAFIALAFSCGSTGGGGGGGSSGGGWEWRTDTDKGNGGTSTITMSDETLEGLPGHVFKGTITKKYEYGFVNVQLYPDDAMMGRLKQAKAISFRVIGNGETMAVKITTSDVKDYAYFEYQFETVAGQPKTVIVPIEYLMQPSWGKMIATSVNLDKAQFIEYQYQGPAAPYEFKLWDFRVHTDKVPTEKDVAPKASVAIKAAPAQAQPIGGELTNVVWNVVDNFEYANGYMIYFADPRLFNGNKITKGDTFTFKFTCTASRDLEAPMRFYLVDHTSAAQYHTELCPQVIPAGSQLKAGVPFSGEITFVTNKSATSNKVDANLMGMETEGKGSKGAKGSGVQKAFTITFSKFEFSKN